MRETFHLGPDTDPPLGKSVIEQCLGASSLFLLVVKGCVLAPPTKYNFGHIASARRAVAFWLVLGNVATSDAIAAAHDRGGDKYCDIDVTGLLVLYSTSCQTYAWCLFLELLLLFFFPWWCFACACV